MKIPEPIMYLINYYGTYILHCVQQRRQQHTDLPVPSDPIINKHVNEVDQKIT